MTESSMDDKAMAGSAETSSGDSPHWPPDGADDCRGEPLGGRPLVMLRSPRVARPLQRLAIAIEQEVVPRLAALHRALPDPQDSAPKVLARLNQADITRFTALVLAPDEAPVAAFIAHLRADGMTIEAVYLDLLAPTARRLGDMWCDDTCTFADVTLGLCRLHHFLRELSAEFQEDAQPWVHGLRALLVPVTGGQHTFGVVMLAEFFRRAGWSVSCGPFQSDRELAVLVKSEWFAVAGFSASSSSQIKALTAEIQLVRRRSLNRAIGIMVGGPLFADDPDLAIRVGADVTATDANLAVVRARELAAAKSSFL